MTTFGLLLFRFAQTVTGLWMYSRVALSAATLSFLFHISSSPQLSRGHLSLPREPSSPTHLTMLDSAMQRPFCHMRQHLQDSGIRTWVSWGAIRAPCFPSLATHKKEISLR